MGWASGSQLLGQIIEDVEEYCHPDSDKVALFTALIEAFEDFDCDTICECLGQSPAFDDAYDRMYPEFKAERLADEQELLDEDLDWQSHREETWGGNFDGED